MARVLIVLNCAGLFLNILIFILVVHYFSGEGATPGERSARNSAVSTASLSGEIEGIIDSKLRTVGSDLAKMSRKLDNLGGQLTRLSRTVSKAYIARASQKGPEVPAAPVEDTEVEEPGVDEESVEDTGEAVEPGVGDQPPEEQPQPPEEAPEPPEGQSESLEGQPQGFEENDSAEAGG